MLQFNGGNNAPLTSPPTCGPNTIDPLISPWSGDAAGATPSQALHADQGAGRRRLRENAGRASLRTRLHRAAPKSAKAGAFSPFSIHITRDDGEQELKGVDVTLPPGLTGKLAGVPYCPPEGDRPGGRPRRAQPRRRIASCPAKSQVGVATVKMPAAAPRRSQINGKAYLAGPYKGAPLSLALVTPRSPGPSTSARSWSGWRCSSTLKRRRSTPSPTRSRTSSAAPSSTSARSTSTSTSRNSPSTRPAARSSPRPAR